MANFTNVAQFQEAIDSFMDRRLNSIQDIEKKRKVWKAVVIKFMIQDVTNHFQKQSGPDGKWKKWSPSYSFAVKNGRVRFTTKAGEAVDFKAKPPRKPGNILTDTARLRNSITPQNHRVKPTGLLLFNPAKTKTGVPYAAIHDEGRGKQPERKFMWLSNKAMGKIATFTVQYAAEGRK